MLSGAVEYCLPETFNVTCAVDEIIMVSSAQYGRMRSGRCIKQNYGHVGCEADVTSFVEDECSGRRHCEFPVAQLLSVAAPCPPDVTSYLDASYSCIKGETIGGNVTWVARCCTSCSCLGAGLVIEISQVRLPAGAWPDNLGQLSLASLRGR